MLTRLRRLDVGPIWVYLIAFGALFFRFGYNYAAGDQDELIPLLLSLVDKTLFHTDWFVQMQAAEIGVRTYVVWLLMPFTLAAPISSVVFGFCMASWVLIGSGAYRVALKLVDNRVAAATAVFVSLGVLHKWTLGSNDMVYSMFVGEMLAWGLALHGLRQWLDERNRQAAVLLGLTTWFQLLVGLLIAGVLVTERLWDRVAGGSPERSQSHDLTALGIFVLAALPSIIPIALQQIEARMLDSESVFYILAQFRNPFHHMFLSFGIKSIVRFGALLTLGLGSLVFLNRRGLSKEKTRLARIVAIILVSCVVTALFTEALPVLIVAKFQAFKLTVLLKFILIVLISGAVTTALPAPLMNVFDKVVRKGRARLIVSSLAVIALTVLTLSQPGFVSRRIGHEVHKTTDLGRMEAWIGSHSDRETIFAVPPSNSTFRSNARRAIVVNYSAFPFDDADMIVWFDRLLDVAPIEHPSSGLGIKPVLDEAYHGHSSSSWMNLARRYDIDFVLVDLSRMKHHLEFERVHSEGSWTLYRIPKS